MSNATITQGLAPIRPLTCCCCGERTIGRQWWNRDTGFGLCQSCAKWIRTRGTGPQDMHSLYGDEGYHYPTATGQVSITQPPAEREKAGTMTVEFELEDPLLSRWKAYQEEAPAWSLQGLIAQLLRQHFNEADTMRESIKEQEQKRGR